MTNIFPQALAEKTFTAAHASSGSPVASLTAAAARRQAAQRQVARLAVACGYTKCVLCIYIYNTHIISRNMMSYISIYMYILYTCIDICIYIIYIYIYMSVSVEYLIYIYMYYVYRYVRVDAQVLIRHKDGVPTATRRLLLYIGAYVYEYIQWTCSYVSHWVLQSWIL